MVDTHRCIDFSSTLSSATKEITNYDLNFPSVLKPCSSLSEKNICSQHTVAKSGTK